MAVRILIVEDNADTRELLDIQLRRMTYEVIDAATGEEGISKAQAESPDLIIMDLGLPGISGIETTVRLKQNPKTAHIPVIALTAWMEDQFRHKALEAGMVEFLCKPTAPQALRYVIEKFLQPKSSN